MRYSLLQRGKRGKTMMASKSFIVLSLICTGVSFPVLAGVSSTYYYEYNLYGGRQNEDDVFVATYKSGDGEGSGTLSDTHTATGWYPIAWDFANGKVLSWLSFPGSSHSTLNYAIDADSGSLHGYLRADAKYADEGGTAMAQTTLKMGARQYYRADGTEPLTVRLNFHYDGSYHSDYLCYLGLGVCVTKVLDESIYFGEFEKGLYLWMLDIENPGGLYEDRWGEKQTVAETLYIHQTDNYGGGLLSPANETVQFEFTVNPGELFTVDTMFDSYITANAQQQSSDGEVDFSNTASSTVELISGDGTLTQQEMPDFVQAFDCTYTG
jgi:hypothetical protein